MGGWTLGPDGLWFREFEAAAVRSAPPLPPGYRRVFRGESEDGTVRLRDEQIAPAPETP